MFLSRQDEALQNWLGDARRTGLPEIGRFCDGLLRDAAAVTAAVTLPLEQRPGGRPDQSLKTSEATDVRPG